MFESLCKKLQPGPIEFDMICNNNMTYFTIFIAYILGLISCGQYPTEKVIHNDTIQSNKKFDPVHTVTDFNEKWTIYFQQDSIYHVKRLITIDGRLNLLSYDINISEPENAGQTFIEDRPITDLVEAEKIKSKNIKYNWKPYRMPRQTLFVQIESSAFKDEMTALKKRQEIEQKIEVALKSNNNGEWTAGDLGPGEANMLFEVQNIDNAISIILDVLSKEGYYKKTLIGRRLNTAKDDWFYEVIYPFNFSGQFLTM